MQELPPFTLHPTCETAVEEKQGIVNELQTGYNDVTVCILAVQTCLVVFPK